MKNTHISKYKNVRSTFPETISLWDWLNDNSLKNEVNYIRSIDNKEDYQREKSKLPCATLSGLFKDNERNVKGLTSHSGYICIDIDGNDNKGITDFKKLRDEIKNVINIAYSGLSVGGKGVFCLIKIKYPEKHKEHFEALKICFEKVGIIIDKACSDITRLRFYSWDDDAYFNEEAVEFEQIYEFRKIIEKSLSITPYKKLSNNGSENATKNRVVKIISRISASSIDITENYEQWFQIGCSLANEFGEEGREFFQLVSQNYPKYHSEATDRLFNQCIEKSYSYKIGTFFHYAEQYGLK